jgi:hypothetical protein
VKVHVDVTAEDIKDGEQRECSKCPLALALIRALPAAENVQVGPWTAKMLDKDMRRWFTSLPVTAMNFVRHFDEGGWVVPISFDLEFKSL